MRDQEMKPRAPADVEQWLAEVRAGSDDALGRLLDRFAPYLLWIANHELDPEVQAKGGASDVVQETFLRAQQRFDQFQGATEEELLAWLRCILRNNLSNFTRQFRAEKRQASREVSLDTGSSSAIQRQQLSTGDPSPSSVCIRGEEAQRLARALDRLSEDHRQAIMLRYREQRSFEEIGRVMGRSPDAARKLWARAIERLQDEMERV